MYIHYMYALAFWVTWATYLPLDKATRFMYPCPYYIGDKWHWGTQFVLIVFVIQFIYVLIQIDIIYTCTQNCFYTPVCILSMVQHSQRTWWGHQFCCAEPPVYAAAQPYVVLLTRALCKKHIQLKLLYRFALPYINTSMESSYLLI